MTWLISLWNLLKGMFTSDVALLISLWTPIIQKLPAAEAKVLADAKTAFMNDISASPPKSYETAAADALTTFFNEESGLIGTTGYYLLQGFFAAFGIKQAAQS